jgi:2-polyprenyl-3-methyl-5-hydroxy-6-metoxy-1,4-benzoquinol methylase
MSEWNLETWMVFAREQAEFFCNLSMVSLPEWIILDIYRNRLSICDFGCSLGHCVSMMSKIFSNSKVVGIDIDQRRIDKAREFFPDSEFLCVDINNTDVKYDIVFSSNTLEHFENPFEIIETLANYANRYLIFLVPFQEYENRRTSLYI